VRQPPESRRASGADTEQDIVRPAHVVFNRARDAAGDHLLRMQLEIRFETSAAEQPDIAAIGHDQHARAGLAIRGSGRCYGGGEHSRHGLWRRALQQQLEAGIQPHIGPACERAAGVGGCTGI
jgi:hypothetical protein